jgi:hydroxymethylbilane synthase
MRIGTRGSALALWQARTVAAAIRDAGGPETEIVVIRTTGDEGGRVTSAQESDEALVNVKRSFVKEIEEALHAGEIDAAVHSSKDLPAVLLDGLTIGAALEREDPRDALIFPAGRREEGLDAFADAIGPRPRVGTSSIRRMAELRLLFPEAVFVPIRGNVDTRLRKLDAGECDVLILAAAGLTRLGLSTRISVRLPIDVCLPAPGQGIVAVEVAAAAPLAIRQAVASIDDADAAAALAAERGVVRALGASCQMPLGALATLDGQGIEVKAAVTSIDGLTRLRVAVRGNRGGAAAVGEKAAAQLLAQGAGQILSSIHTK